MHPPIGITPHSEPASPSAEAVRHVLVAVDDTPGGRRTLASGLEHAASQGAQATVLHVVPARRCRFGRFGPVRSVPMRVSDPLEAPVLREARRVGFGLGVCPRLELIAADDVDATILGVAQRLGAATIVVGASRPEKLVSVGVVNGVVRRAPVPVVVVPA